MIKLDQKVTDGITGFEGVATSITQFLYGCTHIHVVSNKLKDGAIHQEWIDEVRLDKTCMDNPRPLHPILGKKVRDSITGFEGIATARQEQLNGCVRIAVTSKKERSKDDGAPLELWFDEQRLGIKSTREKPTGGPGPVPPSQDCPLR